MRRGFALAAVFLIILFVGSAFAILRPGQVTSCPSFLGSPAVRSELAPRNFGAVTTFSLPSPKRWPNAIAVAPDGSVWFGEEAVPALAHLFVANGSLIEYPFPGAYPAKPAKGYDCADKTDIWGVAIWDGRVWATDSALNRLVGLSPINDTFKVISLAANGSLPYTLTPGTDGALWFTQIGSGQIGTLFPNGTVAEHFVRVPEHLNGTSAPVYVPGVPAQIVFANSTTGYYLDASPLVSGSPVFSFDPAHFSPERVGGGNQSLADPVSIALGDGGIWLAQHAGSSLARYDLRNGSWTIYPTSRVSYIRTTLPYFVETNGSLVWFNEHFGNKMAVLNVPDGTLTEYSMTDPPAGNMSQIANALTSAIGGGRAWFAESSPNAVGFVDASYHPSFSVLARGSSSLSIRSGESAGLQVDLSGSSLSPLSINFSESPSPNGASIIVRAETNQFGPLDGNQSINMTVYVGAETAPGNYTLAVTASDGLIARSVYVGITVLP